jgi:hypothetical protein
MVSECTPDVGGSQGKFDVADFVGSVSEKLIAQSKSDNGRMLPFFLELILVSTVHSFRSQTFHKDF